MIFSKESSSNEEMMQNIKQIGILVLGSLLGDLVARFLLFCEYCHSNAAKSWRKCFEKTLLVYDRKLLLFLVVVGLVALTLPEVLLMENNMKNLCIPAFAWLLLKRFGAFSNSVDDIDMLEQNRYDVAPGLAANCWFSFHEHLVKNNIKEKMEEFTKDIKEAMWNRAAIDEYFNIQIENIRSYNKLMILLPSNCHRDKKLDLASDEKIFQHLPGLCRPECFEGTSKCLTKHSIEIPLPLHVRKDPATLNVHWIFENKEDEVEYEEASLEQRLQNGRPKIFILYDFPQLLQSVMGPGKGWEPTERPLARKRNIEKFKKIIQDFIKSDRECYPFRNDVTWLKFQNKNRKEPLSHFIRREIKAREQENFASSSSGSESEV